MIKIIKSNKTFTCCLFLTIFLFLGGILFHSLIDNDTKSEITKNISVLIKEFKIENYDISLIFKILFNNILEIIFIWLFGISIVGIPVVLFFYSSKVFLFGFELVSLLSNLKLTNILFIIIYMLPSLFKMLILFVLVYYSINYSSVLFKVLFLKKSYNIRNITNRYLKVLVIIVLSGLVVGLLEGLVVPKILAFMI